MSTDASSSGAGGTATAARAPAAPFPAPPRRPRPLAVLSQLGNRYALVGVWIVMFCIYLAIMPDKVWRTASFQSIFGSQEVLVILTFAVLSTLVVGEFDLSFASVMGIAATVIPVLATLHHMNLVLAVVIGLAACAACGVINAFFVVTLGVSSLVVTLGSGTLLIGIAELVSNSTTVSLNSTDFSNLALYPVGGMPVSFWYGLALAAAFAYVCGWTPLGRNMLFVGSNREVARLAGIRVNRVRFGSYIAAALFAGLAGVVLISSVGGYDPTASQTYLLPALAATFLGTAVVQPGQFNPIGAVIGIYFLETGIFGLQLLGYSGWIQDVFYGAGLVIAVALATVVRRRSRNA